MTRGRDHDHLSMAGGRAAAKLSNLDIMEPPNPPNPPGWPKSCSAARAPRAWELNQGPRWILELVTQFPVGVAFGCIHQFRFSCNCNFASSQLFGTSMTSMTSQSFLQQNILRKMAAPALHPSAPGRDRPLRRWIHRKVPSCQSRPFRG